MSGWALGIDLGTSGIRSAVLDCDKALIATARADYPKTDPDNIDARVWWSGVEACLQTQISTLRNQGHDPNRITRIGVDGTSGSVVLTDAALAPVTRALMYNASGLIAEAEAIAALAPNPHITRGAGSALARTLRLLAEDANGRAHHLLHQADFIAAHLMGRGGASDDNNALKTGFDPGARAWPEWFDTLGLPERILPKIYPSGAPIAPIAPPIAAAFGLSSDVVVHAGTTDSIAAFLAAAPLENGAAVTSLGTTLAIKLLSETRIDAPEIGLYSHRLGNGWLVGGASNTGGGVLLDHFTPDQIASLSARIDPTQPCHLDYYPLSTPGERFPINDPALPPRLSPRPEDDTAFLYGLLDGIARIEAQCYAAMVERGAPKPKQLFTAGGGARNPVWTAIRERHLGLTLRPAAQTEACIGTARLISQA